MSEGRHLTAAELLILLSNFNSSSEWPFTSSLLLRILEWADLLPQLHYETRQECRYGNNCDRVYFSAPIPLCRFLRPSSVTLTARSRDQGWSSYPHQQGTRTGSWTWAEVEIVRSWHTNLPSNRHHFFRNIHAGRDWENFTQVHVTGESALMTEILRDYDALRGTDVNAAAGDVDSGSLPSQSAVQHVTAADVTEDTLHIQIRIRAQYPGWCIRMERAAIHIDYELDADWEAFISSPRDFLSVNIPHRASRTEVSDQKADSCRII